MTVRRNVITGQPIVFAPERAGRPHAFIDDTGEEVCPFCPGNESQTPPEILRIGNNTSWRVRVFPNKYPAVENHEVIVESPRHDADFDAVEHAAEVVAVFTERYRALTASHPPYVALFKNHGRTAGASISHIHSQIAAVPFVPPRIEAERKAFANAAECPLCKTIEWHRREGLLIAESESFAWIAPHASAFAYQQWMIPKRHQSEIGTFDEREVRDLAGMLQAATGAMRAISASHNWLFLSFPGEAAAHCYIDLFPRVTNVAGFELETGTYIDVVDPAATVRRMSR
jgi:UDPglucose--hexose-1-phosphate uridylyltransferase